MGSNPIADMSSQPLGDSEGRGGALEREFRMCPLAVILLVSHPLPTQGPPAQGLLAGEGPPCYAHAVLTWPQAGCLHWLLAGSSQFARVVNPIADMSSQPLGDSEGRGGALEREFRMCPLAVILLVSHPLPTQGPPAQGLLAGEGPPCYAHAVLTWPQAGCLHWLLAGSSQFARVVKGVDLRSTARKCAWVRTP